MTDDSDKLSDLSIPVEEVYDDVDGHEVTLCESCSQPMIGTIDVCNECKEHFPFDELEALAETWEQRTDLHREFAYQDCAQDLRVFIEEYGGADD